MNPDHEKQLEAAIDRELKALPPLTAPSTLANRVMSALARSMALPWYRRSWQTWPATGRAVSLALMVAFFGGICFVTWLAPQSTVGVAVLAKVHSFAASAGAMVNACQTVLGALGVAFKHLGTGFLIGTLAAVFLGYLFCVGLGTVTVRLAWARR